MNFSQEMELAAGGELTAQELAARGVAKMREEIARLEQMAAAIETDPERFAGALREAYEDDPVKKITAFLNAPVSLDITQRYRRLFGDGSGREEDGARGDVEQIGNLSVTEGLA